jgi:hypothetical protein
VDALRVLDEFVADVAFLASASGMDGFELARRSAPIRACRHSARRSPATVATRTATKRAAPASTTMTKPVDIDQLLGC